MSRSPCLSPQPWSLADPPPLGHHAQRGNPSCPAASIPLLLRLDWRQAGAVEGFGAAAGWDGHATHSPEGAPLSAPLTVVDGTERQRAARFRRPEDRARFLVGRAALRQVLGAWLDCDPAEMRFRYGPHGKPGLDGAAQAAPHFNLAHSGDLILLAFHPSRPVGVDVERWRPALDWLPIARRILPAAAVARLESLPPQEGGAAFLEAWCRLEARLKASGEGLAGLERLRREEEPHPGELALWDVAVPEGYGAAVALA